MRKGSELDQIYYLCIMQAMRQKRYSREEYFKEAETSMEKLEYYDGWIRNMSGGTFAHSQVAGNIIRRLSEQLDGHQCIVCNSDMAVAIKAFNCYVYPDASVVSGEPEFEDDKQLRLQNPSVLIEVLSATTEAFDRGDKFKYYRSLPSFKEYILIHSDKINIESFYKKSQSHWQISSAYSIEDTFEIQSLGVTLNVRDIYANIVERM